MPNQTNMMLSLQKNLNRAIALTAYPMGKPVSFIIYHHKNNSGIQFQVNSNSAPIKNQEVFISMFRYLENCKFCNAFFNLETLKSPNIDFQAKFIGKNRTNEKYIFPFLEERFDLHSSVMDDNSKKTKNYLSVSGWKLFDLGDDLIFFFVQRRCYNNITRQQIIRTAGLQFATKRASLIIDKYAREFDEGIHKVSHIPTFMNEQEVDEEDEVI